ncbi:COG4 transport protein-domain-containing protein [Polychytrium aggregatum]|uniref:COG4 transport protein-domain-containing protein n=1 Tax=Polychytrium aggregatum TaxID=110093 RepID=UPI0022FEC48A|nr:COG4 transport protein-domain-containing protein [Polychytrium aggregatum]KAI9190863.1 COG4 transport protein-domain-containing protein [Polychytrium aggregatum]
MTTTTDHRTAPHVARLDTSAKEPVDTVATEKAEADLEIDGEEAAAPLQSLPLKDLMQLTDIENIVQQLRIIQEEESQLDNSLDAFLQEKPSRIKAALQPIEPLGHAVVQLKSQASVLAERIHRTTHLADRISSKVRELDLEQSNIQKTIQVVNDLQDLKQCAAGAKAAMDQHDYDQAARFVSKYLGFDASIKSSPILESPYLYPPLQGRDYSVPDESVATANSTSQTSPAATMKDIRSKLLAIFVEGFDGAMLKQEDAEIVKYFKWFSLIGEAPLGLDRYSSYLCSGIRRKCQDAIKSSLDGSSQFSDLLTFLFESIANIVDRQETFITQFGGPGAMLQITNRLEREANVQSAILFEQFFEKRQVQRKVQEVQKKGKFPLNLSDINVEVREVDLILNEMAIARQRAGLFKRFIETRTQIYGEQAATVPSQASDQGGAGHSIGTLSQKLSNMMSAFQILDEYFIRNRIEKALKIDEYETGSAISTCVDDVFYIIRNCFSRVVSTHDARALGEFVKSTSHVIEMDYITNLQKKLVNGLGSQVVGQNDKDRLGYMVRQRSPRKLPRITLNNLDVSRDYLVKIMHELEQQVDQTHGPGSSGSADLERMKKHMGGFVDCCNLFKTVLQTWIDNLFNQLVKPKIKPLLTDMYQTYRYNLTEDEYRSYDTSEEAQFKFQSAMSKLMQPFRSTLTAGNLNQLMTHVVEVLAKEWERILMNMKFTLLGGLRYEKDLRAITAFLLAQTSAGSGIGNAPHREKLSRLYQISNLMNLESPGEIYDCWGPKMGPMAWRMTGAEIRRVLSLR